MNSFDKSKLFITAANCIPVKGVSRSIIYDTQRSTFDFIPNDLYDIIEAFKDSKISQVYDEYDYSSHGVIDEYFSFLIKKDYIILLDSIEELEMFPKIDMMWKYPSFISNAIIDLGIPNISLEHYYNFFEQLGELCCRNFQVRLFEPKYNVLKELLTYIDHKDFVIEAVVPFQNEYSFENYLQFYSDYSKLQSLIVYNCPVSDLLDYDEVEPNIRFLPDMIKDHTFCGNIDPTYFEVNMEMFTESLNYNSCLNKKISVDVNGTIKNCPSMDETYGHISDIQLIELLADTSFLSKWSINKDQIDVCKICEFRYMCTDCRAYVSGIYDKPKKCSYDPVTCTWEPK